MDKDETIFPEAGHGQVRTIQPYQGDDILGINPDKVQRLATNEPSLDDVLCLANEKGLEKFYVSTDKIRELVRSKESADHNHGLKAGDHIMLADMSGRDYIIGTVTEANGFIALDKAVTYCIDEVASHFNPYPSHPELAVLYKHLDKIIKGAKSSEEAIQNLMNFQGGLEKVIRTEDFKMLDHSHSSEALPAYQDGVEVYNIKKSIKLSQNLKQLQYMARHILDSMHQARASQASPLEGPDPFIGQLTIGMDGKLYECTGFDKSTKEPVYKLSENKDK